MERVLYIPVLFFWIIMIVRCSSLALVFIGRATCKIATLHDVIDVFTARSVAPPILSTLPMVELLLLSPLQVCPALAMGNTVVLKPTTYTRLSALLFAEICAEAGLPPGQLAGRVCVRVASAAMTYLPCNLLTSICLTLPLILLEMNLLCLKRTITQ